MDKILDLDKSVASLVKEYSEVEDIISDLGFTEIKNPAMLASVVRIMMLKKGFSDEEDSYGRDCQCGKSRSVIFKESGREGGEKLYQ